MTRKKQPEPPAEVYLTPAQVAAELGMTAPAITLLCRKGEVPGALAPEREWRIPASSVPLIPRRKRGRQWPASAVRSMPKRGKGERGKGRKTTERKGKR